MAVNNKIISSAVAYREKKGSQEWFAVRAKDGDSWELPKSDVRGGESSVSAILRFMRDGLGLKIVVLEEAGRVNVAEQRIVFYLMKQGKAPEEGMLSVTTKRVKGTWLPYLSLKRKLALIREQKVLTQAHKILKAWQKERRQVRRRKN